ncbi:MAG: hypothetical protein ACRELY_00520, partial [Polyangiaceae bacterium]
MAFLVSRARTSIALSLVTKHRASWLVASLISAGALASGYGCGDDAGASLFSNGDSDGGGSDAIVGTTDGQGFGTGGPHTDFPASPILDTPDGGAAPPPNSAALFGAATTASSGGPCLMEPEVGAMYPKNWLRPRFRWIGDQALAQDPGVDAGPSDGGVSENLFEIRVHADNQVNDLVVYTTASDWYMPAGMWDSLRMDSAGVPMTVSVRGGAWDGTTLSSVSAGSSGPMTIAPVDAPGTIVYWTTTSGGPGSDSTDEYNPALKGFRVGDEAVEDVLVPSQVNPLSDGGAGTTLCFGCHNSSPDGDYVAISARDHNPGGPPTTIAFASVDGTGKPPPAGYVSPAAQILLNRVEQDLPVFSPAHFKTGDRVAVSMYSPSQSGPFEIAWTDLEAASVDAGTGIFARTGDANHAALANMSHDGSSILYVSTTDSDTAGTTPTNGALYTIPYNNRMGGNATEVAGANDPAFVSGYPSYSPDDQFIAYTRDPVGTSTYDNPQEQIYVIPNTGGSPTRLTANDPPACSGAPAARGYYDSWPKWSPSVRTDSGNRYYFLVFSSQRNYGTKRFGARLYITPIVVDASGKITT